MGERSVSEPKKRLWRKMDRRQFVKALVSLGILGTVASFFSLLTSLLPSSSGSQGPADNILKYGPEKGIWYSGKSGSEVMLADFDQVGKGASVLWGGSIPAILIRVDESKLRGTTANSGMLAFASACTHLCCIATWHIDRPNDDVLYCRCHDGIFDPYDIVKDVMPNGTDYLGARVISGPPPRALPLIPLEVKDGKITASQPNLETYSYCE
jgi:rieske iron-sulfur protein